MFFTSHSSYQLPSTKWSQPTDVTHWLVKTSVHPLCNKKQQARWKTHDNSLELMDQAHTVLQIQYRSTINQNTSSHCRLLQTQRKSTTPVSVSHFATVNSEWRETVVRKQGGSWLCKARCESSVERLIKQTEIYASQRSCRYIFMIFSALMHTLLVIHTGQDNTIQS